MGNFTKMATDLKDLIRNSLSKAVRMISGPSDGNSDIEKLREVEKLFNWEEYLTEIQKEKIWKIEKK